jgi:putative flippase GtrA
MKNFKTILDKNNKIVRYIFSGVIASSSNFIVLYLLVQKVHLWYLTSAVISFCAGIVVSYFLHKIITFKDYSTYKIHLQFSGFFIFNLFMLGFNTLLIYIFVDIFGFWYLISQVLITCFTASINYFIFNRIIFKNKAKFAV